MAMLYEENRKVSQAHDMSLNERKKLSVTGVQDVEAFDEDCVTLSTVAGQLTVRGSGLKLNRLNLEGGELLVEGKIDALEYTESGGRGRGLFGRLLG